MYDEINYDKNTDVSIIKDCFTNTSDDNKHFNKTTWFMKNNIKLNNEIIPIILVDLNTSGRKVLSYILTHLKYNTTVIKINRKDVITYLGTKDYAIVTNGIKNLLDLGIITQITGSEKDVYNVPMNYIVHGNVDSMIKIVEEKEQQKKIVEEENKIVKSYKELSENHKLKLKLKK